MNELEFIEQVTQFASAGADAFTAFCAVTKGDNGVKGLKRDEFEKRYAQLLASPFARKLAVREAREKMFKDTLAQVCLLADPPEAETTRLGTLLSQARQDPNAVLMCIDAFSSYFDPGAMDPLKEQFFHLYPQFAPVKVEGPC